jgi:hypothetical protein
VEENTFRTGTVLLYGVVAALGANGLDKFVALIGSFASVPLVYIYPALLHYKGIAESRLVTVGHILLMVIGLGAMVHYLHYTFRVDWISTEYSYHGEVPVEKVDLRQGRCHGILIRLGHRFGYDYVML